MDPRAARLSVSRLVAAVRSGAGRFAARSRTSDSSRARAAASTTSRRSPSGTRGSARRACARRCSRLRLLPRWLAERRIPDRVHLRRERQQDLLRTRAARPLPARVREARLTRESFSRKEYRRWTSLGAPGGLGVLKGGRASHEASGSLVYCSPSSRRRRVGSRRGPHDGLAAHAVGPNYVTVFSLPGTQSQRASDLLKREFKAQSGDADAIVFHVSEGTIDSPAVRGAIVAAAGPRQQRCRTSRASSARTVPPEPCRSPAIG